MDKILVNTNMFLSKSLKLDWLEKICVGWVYILDFWEYSHVDEAIIEALFIGHINWHFG